MPRKFLIIATALIVIVSFTVLLTQHRQHNRIMRTTLSPHQPDLIILNSTTYSYDKNGLLKSQLTAPKTLHYEYQNTTVIMQPRMVAYTEKRIPWDIRADYGRMLNGSKIIHLKGHVVLHQPEVPTSPETTITTTELTYYPERSFAETAQDVTIIRPGVSLSAHGMSADLKKGIVTTQSKTRGIYDPNK